MESIITRFVESLEVKKNQLESIQNESLYEQVNIFNLVEDFIDTIRQTIQAVVSMNRENSNLKEKIQSQIELNQELNELNNANINRQVISNNDQYMTYERVADKPGLTLNYTYTAEEPNQYFYMTKSEERQEDSVDVQYKKLYNEMMMKSRKICDGEITKENCNSQLLKEDSFNNSNFDNIQLNCQEDSQITSISKENVRGLRRVIHSKSKEKKINTSILKKSQEEDRSIIHHNPDISNITAFEQIINDPKAIEKNTDESKKVNITTQILKKVQYTENCQQYFANEYGEGFYKNFLQKLIDFKFELPELYKINFDIDNIEDKPNTLPPESTLDKPVFEKDNNKKSKRLLNLSNSSRVASVESKGVSFERCLRKYSNNPKPECKKDFVRYFKQYGRPNEERKHNSGFV